MHILLLLISTHLLQLPLSLCSCPCFLMLYFLLLQLSSTSFQDLNLLLLLLQQLFAGDFILKHLQKYKEVERSNDGLVAGSTCQGCWIVPTQIPRVELRLSCP